MNCHASKQTEPYIHSGLCLVAGELLEEARRTPCPSGDERPCIGGNASTAQAAVVAAVPAAAAAVAGSGHDRGGSVCVESRKRKAKVRREASREGVENMPVCGSTANVAPAKRAAAVAVPRQSTATKTATKTARALSGHSPAAQTAATTPHAPRRDEGGGGGGSQKRTYTSEEIEAKRVRAMIKKKRALALQRRRERERARAQGRVAMASQRALVNAPRQQLSQGRDAQLLMSQTCAAARRYQHH